MTKPLSTATPLLERMHATMSQNKDENDRQFVTALSTMSGSPISSYVR